MKVSYPPLHEVTMYQARCTNCGTIETDYGEFSGWSSEDTPVEQVVECYDWFVRYRYEPAPTPGNPRRQIAHIEELLCPDCQRCEVCGGESAYPLDEHMVCEDHEDHKFAAS